MSDRDFVASTLQRWHDDAVAFVVENFGVEPYPWQRDALRRIAKRECHRLAMKASKGPGKTAVLAWIVLWFLTTRPEAKIGATSITETNIDGNLWPELSKWLSRSTFLSGQFAWSRTRVSRRSDPSKWFAEKRTWPKSGDTQAQADALAGLHADNVMFVLDESGGIPQGVMVTAEAVLANLGPGNDAKVLQAGNPTHTTGPLYRACTQDRHLWEIVTITGDPENPNRSPNISMEWAQQQIASYGRSNPWVMVNVLGEFPPSSINALLGVEEVERAMRRRLPTDRYNWAQKRLGVDVARFGDDRTVLFPRQGFMSWAPVEMRGADTVQIVSRVAHNVTRWNCEMVFVDNSFHWGNGVVDLLGHQGSPVMPVNFADPGTTPRFKNIRSEMWMKMAEWVKAGGQLPAACPALVAELIEPTYTFLGGLFVLEPKDEIKKRLGYSPDLADALALTFAIADMPADMLVRAGVPQLRPHPHALSDGDPFGTPTTDAPVAYDGNPWT
jgi:phage terminase large subunit